MILADKLLVLRTTAGLSQEELAQQFNVSRQSVSKWESGNSIPGISFYFMNWHISWIIWPMAAVIFAAIHSIMVAVMVK